MKWFCLGLGVATLFSCRDHREDTQTLSTTEEVFRLSIVGTSDLHGQIQDLPTFGGYLEILREKRDGVVLVDAGDMFQGTLESNLVEGESVVKAYNHLNYSAVAVGNHEFDFGPVGPVSLAGVGDDPHGALRARAKEATFPFLAANIKKKKQHLRYKNFLPSVIKTFGNLEVGIIGATTMSTPTTTLAANVRGLSMVPLIEAVESEAKKLKKEGAQIIVATIHAGGQCRDLSDPDDLSSCSLGEIGKLAEGLPSGLVDVLVGGHTHQAVAHRVAGIPIIQSYANGKAFGRVDVDIKNGNVSKILIHSPQDICSISTKKHCPPYEGKNVQRDAILSDLVEQAKQASEPLAKRKLGVRVQDRLRRSLKKESAIGNLFVDLMLAARPDADIAITNGGGLRADIFPGEMLYEDLYRANPFDNRFAFVDMKVGKLAAILARGLRRDASLLSIAGATALAKCSNNRIEVILRRNGRILKKNETINVVTSDFLATGTFARRGVPEKQMTFERGETIRDSMAEALSKRGGTLSSTDLVNTTSPRYVLPRKSHFGCASLSEP